MKVGSLYYPFLPAVLDPNMTRTVDLWLKRLTFTTANGKKDNAVRRRGTYFEEHVRDELSEEFRKYPVNPNEIGNCYREIEHGAFQALERVTALNSLRKDVARMLEWAGDESALQFHPLVVVGHPYGAGMTFHGVPCIAFDMLSLMVTEEKFTMCGFDGSIAEVPPISLAFRKYPKDFARFAQTYITNPPGVWFRLPALQIRNVVGCMLQDGVEVSFENRSVEVPRTIERVAFCKPLVPLWEELVACSAIPHSSVPLP